MAQKDLAKLKQRDNRIKIVTAKKAGKKIQKISKAYGVHNKSVPRIWKTYKARGTCNRRKGSGRKSSLNKSDKQKIRNFFNNHPKATAVDAKKDLKLQVTPQTVRNYMHSVGYSFKNCTKKICLTQLQKQRRLLFAKKYRKKSFQRVLFSDECSVWLNRFNGKCWVRKNVSPKVFSPTHSPKVHLWGGV